MSDDESHAVVSPADLAERLGCSDVQVVRWIEHGRLVAVAAGPPWRIRKDDANAWSKAKGAGVLFPEADVGVSGVETSREQMEGVDSGEAPVAPDDQVEREAATSGEGRMEQFNPLNRSARSRTRDDIQSLANIDAEQEAQVYFERAADAYESLNFEPALHYFQKAYQANPDEPLYAAFFAYLRFMSDPSQAGTSEQLLEDVVDRADSPGVQAYVHLFCGRIQKAGDRHEEAREQFRRALEAEPTFEKAKQELRRYQEQDEANQSGIRQFLDGFGD